LVEIKLVLWWFWHWIYTNAIKSLEKVLDYCLFFPLDQVSSDDVRFDVGVVGTNQRIFFVGQCHMVLNFYLLNAINNNWVASGGQMFYAEITLQQILDLFLVAALSSGTAAIHLGLVLLGGASRMCGIVSNA
jgi:uncharacterized membrane-anchored protein YitT (DUF2179 family)